MAISTRSYARPYIGVPGLPRGLKWLIIINVLVFIAQQFQAFSGAFRYLALIPREVATHFYVWQLVTYLFLHGSVWHILFNMLALWMFGAEIEETWGTERFLRFYFFCGVGAGICIVVLNYLFGNPGVPTIGASGAIYGVLLASAILWPDRIILFSFLIPMKMKYFVIIIGAVAFFNASNFNSGISDIGHLGGMAFGYLFMKLSFFRRRGAVRMPSPFQSLDQTYKAWKLARAKKKFQVYLNKQRSDRDRFVN
jgi:membrane associated rhomboid family serine protease